MDMDVDCIFLSLGHGAKRHFESEHGPSLPISCGNAVPWVARLFGLYCLSCLDNNTRKSSTGAREACNYTKLAPEASLGRRVGFLDIERIRFWRPWRLLGFLGAPRDP